MFGSKTFQANRHFIDHGCVGCPQRGADVEIDACAACRWLVEIDETGNTPFVRCDPPAPVSMHRLPFG